MRAAIAIIALGCVLGALYPDSQLIPFRKTLEASRTVHAATQATRWLFLSAAILCTCAFIAWDSIRRGITAGVRAIAGWSDKTFFWVVCGLAFGLRVSGFLLLPAFPLRSDGLWYHTTAIAMAAGQGLQLNGIPTAFRPPGYPTLLALTYRLFEPNPQWAWLWGIAATGIILLTTYRLAERLYCKCIARVATLIISVYPALILYTGLPLSDLIFTAGLMLVLYAVALRPPYRWLETLGIGLALGVLTLTRGVAIGLFAVVPLLWFIKQANLRKLFFHFILLACAFAVCLIPWLLRNYAILGTPTIGTNLGVMLYIGNHTDASGGYDIAVLPPSLMESDRKLSEEQTNQIFLQAAIDFVVAHPIHALSILPKKIIQLFLLEVTAAVSFFQDQTLWLKYITYAITQMFYLPILICFVIRTINLTDAGMRPKGIQWIGFIVTLYFTAMAMIFFGEDRYRLPFLPWMVIESSIVLALVGGVPQNIRNSSDRATPSKRQTRDLSF